MANSDNPDINFGEEQILISELEATDFLKIDGQLLKLLVERLSNIETDETRTEINLEQEISIVFESLNMRTKKIRFLVQNDWNVKKLKEKIQQFYEIPLNYMSVIHGGEIINDNRKLENLGKEIYISISAYVAQEGKDNFTIEDAKKSLRKIKHSGAPTGDATATSHFGTPVDPPTRTGADNFMEFD